MFASTLHRLSLVLVMLSACFAEVADPAADPATDTTTAQTCAPGAVGCECYGNATCDAGLECAAQLDVCVPMDCTPGSEQCVCASGLCDAELVCDEGLCTSASSPDTGSLPGDSSGSSSGGASSPDSSGDVGEATSAPGTSGTDAESGSESGGTPECGSLSCGECVVCVAEPEGGCASEAAECDAQLGCSAAATCLSNCGVKGLCLDDCCDGTAPAAAAAAVALNECRHDTCAVACGDYNVGLCG